MNDFQVKKRDSDRAEKPFSRFGLYVHVPFCRSKCAYCDFYSLPLGRVSEGLRNAYASALCEHISLLGERTDGYVLDTVFFGGGTPSLLETHQLAAIFAEIERSFKLDGWAEITLEANPATFEREKLLEFRRLGINRLSIGVQSGVEAELRLLGRAHTVRDAEVAVNSARECGFDNINLDIMYGIPSQTEESFGKTLELVKALAPEHVSVYGLQLEEGTALWRRRDKYSFPDEDTENALNRQALSVLSGLGYKRYEISNYAKEGLECRHNLGYWKRRPYLGVGAAAHSCFSEERFYAPSDINAYVDAVKQRDNGSFELGREVLSADERAQEYLMLGMRLSEGISPEEFSKATQMSFDEYEKRLSPFVDMGFVRHSGGRYAFTPEGFDVSNRILAEII